MPETTASRAVQQLSANFCQSTRANVAKHGISFDEAVTVFYDESARVIFDPDNSFDEDRYLILGMSEASRLLLVCHVYRRNDEVIRVISARRATSREERQYWSFMP
ncbi:BrnT family toxin [Leptolyngbya sp. KIOST-1]|uniref:BrnT family toxin n=1 Tax=Leptolyngbya sp. KIOST-1 TaxID=1229172 RepID=UPI0009077A3B|nr:BrnT family toxin [Leptolyngbya sp. KIOST-1]